MGNNREEIKEILTCLRRMEDKIENKLNVLEKRMDKVESFQSYLRGAGVVVAAVLGAITTWIIRQFGG
tara:strand:+ start:2388 stop:2591 length:204 start_codon:yes stop_codon:yes gene_type:complete